ncbi:hypothetical protein PTKIN_Ptkin03bG0045800 [Pterospermum kingtungense]
MRFHTEALNKCLELDDDEFGFIMMDGNKTLFSMLCVNSREVLHIFCENGYNYVRKTDELATIFFIDPALGQPNVSRLILAGSGKYFEKMREDTGKCVFDMNDTLKALEMGATEIVIVWEDLDITRYVLKKNITGKVVIKYLSKKQEADMSNFHNLASSADMYVQEKMLLVGVVC